MSQARTPRETAKGIVYAIATAIGGVGLAEVAGQAVAAIHAAGLLQQAIAFRGRLEQLPPHLMKEVRFQPVKVFSWLPSRYYYSMKRSTLDRAGARFVRRHGAAVVHGWTNECLETLKAAREVGAVAVVERNYCHPRQSLEILTAEYAFRGLAWPPAPHPWLKSWDHWTRDQNRAVAEFDLADFILLPSQFAYDTFRARGYPPEKLVLLLRGVDVGRFHPKPPADAIFRVLFVGQLGLRKGVLYLLEAWERLGLKQAELILAGSVHEEIKPFLSRYRSRSDIKIVGFQKDPAPLFAASSVFCFPSLDEGAAKVTFEAMAAGLPVITTPQSGSPVRDGLDGFLVAPRDAGVLEEKLLYLYQHAEAAAELGRSARSYIESFTWQHYAANLVRFYRGIWPGTG
jgi:glycosyltransferase involved in cell wall biosynthesis